MTTRRRLGEVRTSSELSGVFVARAVTYMGPGVQPDDYGSLWAKGCFTESLKRRMPVIAWSHDWSSPVGRAQRWQDTAMGPEIECRLDVHPDVPLGRQALAQLASGTITDVSVGFSNARRRDLTSDERAMWPAGKEVIVAADLDELSLVLRGAVKGAEVLSVRTPPSAARRLADLEQEIEEALTIIERRAAEERALQRVERARRGW